MGVRRSRPRQRYPADHSAHLAPAQRPRRRRKRSSVEWRRLRLSRSRSLPRVPSSPASGISRRGRGAHAQDEASRFPDAPRQNLSGQPRFPSPPMSTSIEFRVSRHPAARPGVARAYLRSLIRLRQHQWRQLAIRRNRRTVSRAMADACVRFAKRGNPDGEGLPRSPAIEFFQRTLNDAQENHRC